MRPRGRRLRALSRWLLQRPDIAIFCREPEELDEAITLLPEAVVEVVSRGYEAKDLEIGPRFYLSQGVKDVVVFDPYTLLVLHLRRDGASRYVSLWNWSSRRAASSPSEPHAGFASLEAPVKALSPDSRAAKLPRRKPLGLHKVEKPQGVASWGRGAPCRRSPCRPGPGSPRP